MKIKAVTTKDEMKQFLRIFAYWHKQGLLGFVPIFILYRVKDRGELIILKKGSKVIGIAWMIPRKRPYEFYQMKTLALDRDWTGKGLGKKFLESLVNPLHDMGYDVTTGVLTSNKRALDLYKDAGFKTYQKKKSQSGIETYEMILSA